MALNAYLKRAGLTTGPLIRNTSHSRLEVVKKFLLCLPQFKGGESFLVFGNELHLQWLQNKGEEKLSLEENKKIKAMLQKLRANPICKMLYANSVREQKLYTTLHEVEIALILDIEQQKEKRGADLKTTTCRNLKDFVEKAIEYGYFRQGKTYKLARKLKHFYFIAIQKEPPYNIFIMDVSAYPAEEQYAEEELEFLLYFYKNYGYFITEENNGKNQIGQNGNSGNEIATAKTSGGKSSAPVGNQPASKRAGKVSPANKAVPQKGKGTVRRKN